MRPSAKALPGPPRPRDISQSGGVAKQVTQPGGHLLSLLDALLGLLVGLGAGGGHRQQLLPLPLGLPASPATPHVMYAARVISLRTLWPLFA